MEKRKGFGQLRLRETGELLKAELRWYEAHGYDFVVFTDHTAVTDTDDTAMLTFPGVELTRNLYRCVPPAPDNILNQFGRHAF